MSYINVISSLVLSVSHFYLYSPAMKSKFYIPCYYIIKTGSETRIHLNNVT